MKLNYAKQSDVVTGRILYTALILIDRNGEFYNYLEKIIVKSKPFRLGRGDLFFKCSTSDAMFYKEDDLISLEDNGIIPNGYNLHKTFTDIESANAYIEVFMNGDVENIESIISSGVVDKGKLQQKIHDSRMKDILEG